MGFKGFGLKNSTYSWPRVRGFRPLGFGVDRSEDRWHRAVRSECEAGFGTEGFKPIWADVALFSTVAR